MPSSAYDNFQAALQQKAPKTRKTYDDSLKQFMKHYRIERHDLLLSGKNEELEDRIKDFFQVIRNTKKSYSTANKTMWALRKFYSANRVVLNWDHVSDFMPPKPEKEEEDRPYTHEEVSLCVSEADDRTKTAILMMATSAMRIAALPGIRIKDMEFIDKYDLYCIKVYPLDQDGRYRTFITPQASQFVDLLKGNRKDNDFLFLSKKDGESPITEQAIINDIWLLLQKVGIRHKTTKYERKEVQQDHGFRKFATTTWEACGILSEYRTVLDGHNRGLQARYSKLPSRELIEVCKYPQAIQSLTF